MSGAGHRARGATVSGAESASIGHGGATVSGDRPAEPGRDRSGERGRVRKIGLAEIVAASGPVSGVGAAGTEPGPWPSVVPGWAAPGPCGLRRVCWGAAALGAGRTRVSGAGQHRASQLGSAAAVRGRAPRVLPVSSAGPARSQLGGSPGLPPWAAGLPRAVPASSRCRGNQFGNRGSVLRCEAATPCPAPPGAAAGRARPWHGSRLVLRGSYANRAAPCPESHLGTPRAALEATSERLDIAVPTREAGATLLPPPGMRGLGAERAEGDEGDPTSPRQSPAGLGCWAQRGRGDPS